VVSVVVHIAWIVNPDAGHIECVELEMAAWIRSGRVVARTCLNHTGRCVRADALMLIVGSPRINPVKISRVKSAKNRYASTNKHHHSASLTQWFKSVVQNSIYMVFCAPIFAVLLMQ
jgi:hypothetical protein